jgi:hypothetical protein
VIAVVFMPPTVIASIYGMNFKEMPELNWQWGSPGDHADGFRGDRPVCILPLEEVAVMPVGYAGQLRARVIGYQASRFRPALGAGSAAPPGVG